MRIKNRKRWTPGLTRGITTGFSPGFTRGFTRGFTPGITPGITAGLTAAVVVCAGTLGGLSGCSESAPPAAAAPAGLQPQAVADMLHAVMAADRKVYVANVVNRLTKAQDLEVTDKDTGETKKLKGSEDWENIPGTLPLPAQQFRYGSEEAYKKNDSFNYGLISSWPINKNHEPDGEVEETLIKQMEASGGPVYGEQEIGGESYFIAMYPDRATAKACWDCHNKHKDSPRTDFEENDIMGGIVIRLPI